MQLETLDNAGLINYIRELEACIKAIQRNYETSLAGIKESYEALIKEIKNENIILKEQNALLLYKRFARSAEQLAGDKNQLLLFNEGTESAAPAKIKDEEYEEIKSFRRRKAGRKAIDPAIPRAERVIDIAETEKTCACGAKLTRIGEETSEKLHITPPKIYVEKIIRPKYACRCCEGTEDEEKKTVRIAPAEPSIIPKSIVTPSLLACIMIQKYEDHLPFYRQEKQFGRIMARISRQNMANWQQQAYNVLQPLFKLLKATVISGPVTRMDETEVQVMGEKDRKDTQTSYMWLALGGPPGKTVALYQYRQTRSSEHAGKILEGYSGYLQTDGYEGYDKAVKAMPAIRHVGCFAHVRRKFFEAAKVAGQGSTAEEGIRHIKKLYVIEGRLRKRYENEKDSEDEKERKRKIFTRVRQLSTWRALREFKEWLVKQRDEVPPSVLLGKAVGYSLSQWEKLARYLESPYLTPDNNACENAIRPFVLGRKNWLFNKSPEGAESSCGMYTLIQTAKLNGFVPLQYLTALFEKAPLASSTEDWEKLLPWNIFNP